QNLPLPSCFDHLKRPDKRDGNRHALIARLAHNSGRLLTVANVHLEVFGTMRCRGIQMKYLLDHLPAGAVIVTGAFNTNTFSRGSVFHKLHALALLGFTDVGARVSTPMRFEPVFKELAAAGFSWSAFNDAQPTFSVDLASLEKRIRVPAFVRRVVL